MDKQIKGVGYDGKVWLLIDDVTQVSIKRGDIREDGNGQRVVVNGGTPPKTARSPGSIATNAEVHIATPSVYGCKWQRF